MGNKQHAHEQAPQRDSLLLDVSSLSARYGRRQVLFGIDLQVRSGEVVAIFGHNGAGKTTALKAILGLERAAGGRIEYSGEDVTDASCYKNVRNGMAYIAADDFVFAELSVLDNLKLGAYLESSRTVTQERIEQAFELFPILGERSSQAAGTMSGGEQRMLSIGMALMSGPRLLLVDEPSLGLSPALVEHVMEVLGVLARERSLSVLLVEQNIIPTLPVIERAYFMRSGRVILEESTDQLRERESYWELF